MIDLDFRSKDINTNSKLSAIFTADNFVYACFDQDHNMLSYSSGHKAEEFNAIANSFDPSNLKIAIKTTHFGHFGDKSRIPFDKHKLTLDKMTDPAQFIQGCPNHILNLQSLYNHQLSMLLRRQYAKIF